MLYACAHHFSDNFCFKCIGYTASNDSITLLHKLESARGRYVWKAWGRPWQVRTGVLPAKVRVLDLQNVDASYYSGVIVTVVRHVTTQVGHRAAGWWMITWLKFIIMCGCVYVWVLLCVCVCMCGFCNVWVCVWVDFVMCGCFDNCVGVSIICLLVF